MAKIIHTQELDDLLPTLHPEHQYWIYNGLDCCLTADVYQSLMRTLTDETQATYERALDFQAPILDMMLRGTLIDQRERARVSRELQIELDELERRFDRLVTEGLGRAKINYKSHIQVKELFYDVLKLPVIKERNTNGVMAPSSSRAALERLSGHHYAYPFAQLILQMRDRVKALGFLKTQLDADNRIRCSFNLAGTKTGRLSSSFSDSGTGTNLQNIDRNLRNIFVPDPGKVFVNVDIQQGDSRNVGVICWQIFYESHGPEFAGAYLDACESGDLHTYVCRMGWPELPWVEDLNLCKPIAKRNWYRDKSFRDGAKILGHGSNFGGKPKTMAGHTKTPVKQIANFQSNYFGAFPCIPAWHEWVAHELRTTSSLIHPFGRRRFFWDRHDKPDVLNAALAYGPQGMTGEEINIALFQLWQDPRFELLIQVHDSILFQVPQDQVNELVPVALDLLRVELPLVGGRSFHVAFDAEVGWNWGKHHPERNPYGMVEWEGEDLRKPPRRLTSAKRIVPQEFLI